MSGSALATGIWGVRASLPPDWTLLRGGPDQEVWRTAAGDRLAVEHVAAPLLVGPFLLETYRHDLRLSAARHQGGLVECELDPQLGVVGVVKQRQAGGAGVTIRGYALLPTSQGHLALSVLAHEGPQTGAREAAFLRDSGRLPADWLGDPYGFQPDAEEAAPRANLPSLPDPWGPGLFLRTRSDTRRLDSVFPGHPLTRVRRALEQLAARLEPVGPPQAGAAHELQACGVRAGLPLGFLPVGETPLGCVHRRVSFQRRIQLLIVSHRPRACAREPQAVRGELGRLHAAGDVTLREGPRLERRSLGGRPGVYAEFESATPRRELYTASFTVDQGSHAVELALSVERDDWQRANRELEALVRSVAPLAESGAAEVSDSGLERIYATLVRLAYSDGVLDREERDVLDAFALRYDLPAERAGELERAQAERGSLALGRSRAERNLLLQAMVELAVADGVLDPAELRRLRRVARLTGVPEDQLMTRIQQRLA